MDSPVTFDEYTYLEPAQITVRRTLPETFPCKYAPGCATCYTCTPIGEKDLYQTLNMLSEDPNIRCVLVNLLSADRQVGYPMGPEHLDAWCKHFQERYNFYIHANPEPGADCPCSKTPACKNFSRLSAQEIKKGTATVMQHAASLGDNIYKTFAGLEGKNKDMRNYKILQSWGSDSEPNDTSKPISIQTLTKNFGLSNRQKVNRVLAKARKINPEVYEGLRYFREQRATINHAYEVRHT